MNKKVRKKCIVCLREFEVNTHSISGSSNGNFRMKNSLTCSKKCSRIYERIREYFYNNCKVKRK